MATAERGMEGSRAKAHNAEPGLRLTQTPDVDIDLALLPPPTPPHSRCGQRRPHSRATPELTRRPGTGDSTRPPSRLSVSSSAGCCSACFHLVTGRSSLSPRPVSSSTTHSSGKGDLALEAFVRRSLSGESPEPIRPHTSSLQAHSKDHSPKNGDCPYRRTSEPCKKASKATKTPRPLNWAALGSIERAARLRGLTRHQDPLADPCLLELAEQITGLMVPGCMVAMCGDRLRSRVGQRFVSSVRSLGAHVLPGPHIRGLAKWLQAPRVVCKGQTEALLLVTDWRQLHNCITLLQEAVKDLSKLTLLGVLVLCEHQEKQTATQLAATAGMRCPWRVIATLALSS